MKYSKIMQLQYEIDTWMRTLQFMQVENANLKNRLADVVKEKVDKKNLPEIESFQNCFIGEDEVISLLTFYIKKHKGLLDNKLLEEESLVDQVANKQKMIRHDIEKAEISFCKVKSDFNNYLSEIL